MFAVLVLIIFHFEVKIGWNSEHKKVCNLDGAMLNRLLKLYLLASASLARKLWLTRVPFNIFFEYFTGVH